MYLSQNVASLLLETNETDSFSPSQFKRHLKSVTGFAYPCDVLHCVGKYEVMLIEHCFGLCSLALM